MNRFFKVSALLVLAGSFWSFPFLSSGQGLENKSPFGFFNSDEREETPPAENNPPGLLDLFIQPDSNAKPPTEEIVESEVDSGAPSRVESKTMVQVPEALSKKDFDAADFNDPFYRVRGFQGNSENILKPGTTLDGVQFQNYGDSEKFVERFYRESGFS